MQTDTIAHEAINYVLLSTEACHLCEDAQALLTQLPEAIASTMQKVDITEPEKFTILNGFNLTAEQWVDQYGESIPVLSHLSSGFDLYWPFDLQLLQSFVQACEAESRA